MNIFWVFAIIRCRFGRVAGASLGVALTVALSATLGFFLASSSATMTTRAVDSVPIDWQIEMTPGANPVALKDAIVKAENVSAINQVLYAQSPGFRASTGNTVQTTGAGKVIAFDATYLKNFSKEVRLLSGKINGVLIAQQTAANLHVGPGDQVTIKRAAGLSPVQVTIAGVVGLPDADSLFQAVGLPPQAAPQAPPDNVLILPVNSFHSIFDAQQAARPDLSRLQYHVRLAHQRLPVSPTAAYTQVTGAARNLETRVTGQALVANNLGARLDAVRGDALYGAVLFLFLGVPGVGLAAALTLSIAAGGADGRRREQILLRVRGASTRRILSLAATEAVVVGLAGIILGLGLAALFARFYLPFFSSFGMAASSAMLAIFLGITLAFAAVLLPAWASARGQTVAAARLMVGRKSSPLWQRYRLDLLLLGAAGLLFWQSASTGYQIVLAPEGVPATSVDYKAFLSPALFWAGSALLMIRFLSRGISANGALLKAIVKPVSGSLAALVTASLSRQSKRLTLGIVMTALAVSFAISTAIFNTTYNAQARIDAELTNGSDVTVFGTAANPASAKLSILSRLSSTAAAVPMMHRFAYVGSDLQDIYGINAKTISHVSNMSDAFFQGASAAQTLAKLAVTPDGILVSAETVKDFQLAEGETVNLRMVFASDNQYHVVPFKFIGIAREFPTAPKDSFLVANADYLAKVTGNPAAEYVLMRSVGTPAGLAAEVRMALAKTVGLEVKDIANVTHIIGSSLTAVDLSGLSRIELAFAVIMAAAAAGLMLALGFSDRKRNFAILTVMGAKSPQLGAFLWSEGILVISGGLVLGMITGTIIAWMLVKLLTGVFDPPPEALAIPWPYITGLILIITVSVFGAVGYAQKRSPKNAVEVLRDL